MAELDSLTIRVEADTHDADEQLGKLATAIGRINQNTASLNSATNSFKGFARALSSINRINVGDASNKIVGIADAISILAMTDTNRERVKDISNIIGDLKNIDLKGMPSGKTLIRRVREIRYAIEELGQGFTSDLSPVEDSVRSLNNVFSLMKGVDTVSSGIATKAIRDMTEAITSFAAVETPSTEHFEAVTSMFGMLRTAFEAFTPGSAGGGIDVNALRMQMEVVREIVMDVSAMSASASTIDKSTSENILTAITLVNGIAQRINETAIAVSDKSANSLKGLVDAVQKIRSIANLSEGLMPHHINNLVECIKQLRNAVGAIAEIPVNDSTSQVTTLIGKIASLINAARKMDSKGVESMRRVVEVTQALSEMKVEKIEGTDSTNVSQLSELIRNVTSLTRLASKVDNESIVRLMAVVGSMEKLSQAHIGAYTGDDGGGLVAVLKSVMSMTRLSGRIDEDVVGRLISIVGALRELAEAASKIGHDFIINIEARGKGQIEAMAEEARHSVGAFAALRGAANIANIALDSVKAAASGAGTILRVAFGGMKAVASGAVKAFRGITNAVRRMSDGFRKAMAPATRLFNLFTRRALSMAIRAIVKDIASGFQEGLEALTKVSADAAATMNNLSSGIGGLKASMGSALYSALNLVAGALQNIISVATTAMNTISALFAALGGGTTYMKGIATATESYGNAASGAGKAAKELKTQLMAFDEINKLNENSSPSGGGGGSGIADTGAIGTFIETEIPKAILDAISSGNFTAIGEMLAAKINSALADIPWDKIRQQAGKFAGSLTTLINGFVGGIDAETIGNTLSGVLTSAITFLNDFWYGTDWKTIGIKMGISLNTMMNNIDASSVAEMLLRKFKAAIRMLGGFLQTFDLGDLVTYITNVFVSAADKINDKDWNDFCETLGNSVGSAINAIDPAKIGSAVTSIVNAGIKLIGEIATEGNMTTLAVKFVQFVMEGAKLAAKAIPQLVNIGLAALNGLVDGIKSQFTGENREEAIATIRSAFEAFVEDIDWSLIPKITINAMEVVLEAGFDLATAIGQAIGKWLGIPEEDINTSTRQITMDWELGMKYTFTKPEERGYTAQFKDLALGGIITDNTFVEVSDSITGATKNLGQLNGMIVEFRKYADLNNLTASGAIHTLLDMDPTKLSGELLDLYIAVQNAMDGFTNVDIEVAKLGADIETLPDLDLANWFAGTLPKDAQERTQYILDFIHDVSDNGWQGNIRTLAEALKLAGVSIEELGQDCGLSKDQLEALKTVMGLIDDTTINVEVATDTSGAEKAETAITTASEKIRSFKDAYERRTSNGNTIFDKSKKSADNAVISFDAASESAGKLEETIKVIPSSTDIYINLANYSSIIADIKSVKSMISSVTGKTVKITVDAHLSAGAKNFLSQLKSITGGGNITTPTINAVLNANAYARGGYPNKGDLFIANENGAEMVGAINGKTAVANENEIGDAIFKYMDAHAEQNGSAGGVDEARLASAIVSALRSAGMGAVYLDGRQLAQSINREVIRSGRAVLR